MQRMILAVMIFLSTGCAMQQPMRSPDGGKLVNCKAHYYGLIGVVMAYEKVADCRNHYEALGYTKATKEEYEAALKRVRIAPKPEFDAGLLSQIPRQEDPQPLYGPAP